MLSLTFFEATTALAFWHFAKEQVDIAVIEVGMGGRWDATNVIEPLAAVLTRIGLDHEDYLGDQDGIITEKIGIIKPKAEVITLADNAGVERIRRRAEELGCPCRTVGEADYVKDCARFGLDRDRYGFHSENLPLALAAVDALNKEGAFPVDERTIAAGIRDFYWPARFDLIQPRLMVDGAHNVNGMRWLAVHLKPFLEREGFSRCIAVFGCLADKRYEEMAEALLSVADRIVVTEPSYFRRLRAEDLARVLPKDWVVAIEPDVAKAARLAEETADERTLVLITGSIYLVGGWLAGKEEEKARKV